MLENLYQILNAYNASWKIEKMKAIVAHHYWDRAGGGELVDSSVVKALQKMGLDVIIVATTGFRKNKYKEWFGIDLENVRTYVFLKRFLPIFGIYQRAFTWVPLKRAIKKEKPDLIWIDTDLYKPIGHPSKIIEYVHFPTPRWEETLDYHVKYSKGLWKYYFKGSLVLYKLFGRENPFIYADVVTCNSTYIQNMMEELWGHRATVIHPPVLVNEMLPSSKRGFNERSGIVMIGRISPEKRYEDVIEAIFFSNSKPRLKIVGGLIPSRIDYLNKIKSLAKQKKIELEVYPNASRKDLINIASSSKLFIHATRHEHFGIAVVEGMALGCPVIIHRSGGQYSDITQMDKYGKSYESTKELTGTIDTLYANPKKWKALHNSSIKRCKEFDRSVFNTKVQKIVKQLIG